MKKWAVYQSRSKYDHKKGFRKNPKGYVYAETEEQAHIEVGKHIFIPDGYWAKVIAVEKAE